MPPWSASAGRALPSKFGVGQGCLCQGVSCIPRDQSRGPRMRRPGAQKQSEGTRQQHTGGFCSEEKLLPGQGQHAFVLLPGILAFFFQNNGGVCAPCEGKTGEQCCCAAPSPDNARGHACHPCSAVRGDLCLGSDDRRQGREDKMEES